MALIDIIKHEVSDNELVGKFKSDMISLGSQLVVYPGQTAFFVKDGKICDEFNCGKHTLTSGNIPLLKPLVNLPFGGDTPFPAEVWFINRVSILDCKWGTLSPIQIEDPKYDVIVPIKAHGQYGIRISHPRLFLERLIGNMPSFSTGKLTEYFRGVVLSKLTNIITAKLYTDGLSVININAHVDEISDFAGAKISSVFEEYGIALEMFRIIQISVDHDDPSFRRLKETKDALAKIKIMGNDNYRLERSFNILETAAGNEGAGTVGAAVGLGAGAAMGAPIGAIAATQLNIDVPPLPTELYYLGIAGERKGPISHDEVNRLLQNDAITPDTLIWKRGMSNWAKISELSEFSGLTGNFPPPLPDSIS